VGNVFGLVLIVDGVRKEREGGREEKRDVSELSERLQFDRAT
jgi:hypothetical protein